MAENPYPYTPTADDDISASGPATASVATSQTTASSSYTDLATAGPAVTVTIGASGKALVIVGAQCSNAGGFPSYMAFAVSGATTRAAVTAEAYIASDTDWQGGSRTTLITGLTPGVNTFTAKYVVDSNTGTWVNRQITVIPL